MVFCKKNYLFGDSAMGVKKIIENMDIKQIVKNMDTKQIIKVLDYIYDLALEGLPKTQSIYEFSDEYLKDDKNTNDLESKIDLLIRNQIMKCGTSGFLTSLGGAITLPITIPASILASYYVQIRMIAAIAIMNGYDVKSDQVRTLCYSCLLGNEVKDILKNIGISVGQSLTHSIINKISGEVLTEINRSVGFRLITKFGETGTINMGKTIPIVAGLVGGGFDAYYSNLIGKAAKTVFLKS